MARPKSIDDSKVFDVSKPGNGKPSGTSRPVILNHSSMVQDSSVVNTETAPPVKIQPPSITKKIIEPLNKTAKSKSIKVASKSEDAGKNAEPVVVTAPELKTEAETKPEDSSEDMPIVEIKDEPKTEEVQNTEKDTPAKVDDSEEKVAQTETTEDENKSEAEIENEQTESSDTPVESSESASVDAVAGEADKRRKITKEDSQQAKVDAKIAELTASKQYFVPLAHDSTKHHTKHVVTFMLLTLVLLVIGVYLATDAGLIDVGIKVPFELIRE